MTGFQITRLIIRKCGLSGKLEERVGAEEGGGACVRKGVTAPQ